MKAFSNYTQKEIKEAKFIAFHFLYGTAHIVLGHSFKYDARTRIGTLASSFVRSTVVDRYKIKSLQKQRSLGKSPKFSNVLSNPLVIDYRANKGSLKQITNNALHFYGRNHWAKTALDHKILSVLSK